MEENCGERETKDGFCYLDEGCHFCGKQSRIEEANQWPYSPRGELGTNNNKISETALFYKFIGKPQTLELGNKQNLSASSTVARPMTLNCCDS